MRKFRVYIDHGYAGCPPEETVVEMPENATDAEIFDECREALDVLFSNLDSGWEEVGGDQ